MLCIHIRVYESHHNLITDPDIPKFNFISAMATLAAITIYFFGVTAFVVGIVHLLSPSNAVASLSLPESCAPAANGTYTILICSPHVIV